jgi:tetratricopeptide (TPR) repeat protein
MTRFLVLGALASLLALSAPRIVEAQETAADLEARTHFEAARLHFERGAYEEAQREFQAAYDLSHRAELLYNLYLTAERLADYDMAIGYLEHYLAEGTPDAERRASLEPRLENLRARRDRHATSDEPDVTTPDPVTAPTPAHGGDIVPAAVAFAVAGVGLLSFAIVGGLALAEDSSLETTCGTSCSDAQVSTLGTLTIVSDVSWITAAVAATAGVILLLTVGMPSGESSESARVVPWLAPTGGGGVVAEGSF